MFSQLKSMVASAVTQDPIYEYKVDDKSMFLCGRNEVFRVKSAVEISSGKEVSIFQVKVADLVARQEPAADSTFFLERVRHSVMQLSQLRHPGVLRIERALVEVPGKKLWFVTERVKAWVPHLPLKEIPRQLRVLGLRRCAETLRFLHETADLMLVDFSPQALFVTTDGRWKIGDFVHAVRRTELMAEGDNIVNTLCTPSRSFRSVGAPLLDYVAAELVDWIAKGSAAGGSGSGGGRSPAPPPAGARGGPSLADLMGGGGGNAADLFSQPMPQQQQRVNLSAPLGFPDSDVYSFLLTVVEVLNGGKKLFACVGSLDQHRALRATVEREVDRYFPNGALTNRPRPPMSTVMATGPFASADMQLLDQIERYDTLDPNERFSLFKTLYSCLGPTGSTGGPNDFSLADFTKNKGGGNGSASGESDGMFCEVVIVENIIPLMKRESKQASMLRFVLPIMLQCCYVFSSRAFEEHLREYFTALINAMIKAKPPWYEKVGVLAQLMLEKFDVLSKHMNTTTDKTQILMPFLMKCLYTDDVGGNDHALLGLALNAMAKLFDAGGEAALATLVPTNDAAANLAGKLTIIGSSHPTLFTSAFSCLEKILAVASMATKEAAEVHLIQALRNKSNSGSSEGTNPAVSISSETRQLQLQSMMATLQKLENDFSREHAAAKSIPQLSPLLLSSNRTVRAFAVQCIDKHLGNFRSASDVAAAGGGGPDILTGFSLSDTASVAKPSRISTTSTAMDFFLAPSAAAAGFTTTRQDTNPSPSPMPRVAAGPSTVPAYHPPPPPPPTSSQSYCPPIPSYPSSSAAAPAWSPAPTGGSNAGTSTIHFAPPPTASAPNDNGSSCSSYNGSLRQNNNTNHDIFDSLGLS